MNFKKYISKYMTLSLVFIFTLAINPAYSQEKITVNGSVSDEQGLPVVGANVVVENTTNGTITDLNGKFTITCNEGETLLFSLIGHKKQSHIAQANMAIVMETDEISLADVTIVSIGYGSMRKGDLTGAITSVTSDDFNRGVVNSNEQLLQGKVAGLTVIKGGGDPASGASMRLRGGTSLSASNGPLVVIDGVAGADINAVQSNEIVSMDVLKDASATAIYGSRGANGVIIITTNREKKGKSVEYNGYVAVGTVAKNLDLLSADQWRKYVRDNNVGAALDYGADTDWQKELEQTAVTQSHSLSFSSSTENGGLRASLNYLKSDGIIKTSYLDRFGGSINAFQYALNNKLKLDLSLHANTDKWSTIDYSIFERAYNLNPTIPVRQNGDFTQIGGTNNNNPVEILMNRSDESNRKRILGNFKAELEIINGLKAIANASYEYNSTQGNFYLPSYSFNGITDKGYGRRSLGDYKTSQIETYLSYDFNVIEDFKLNVMGGYSYLYNFYSGFGSERRGFDTDLFDYDNLAAGQDYRAGDVYSYKGEAKLASFFGRTNFNYRNRYLFTATLRRDGSSRFGANNKWGTFPSVSLAWRISEESFMENTKNWLGYLKLRTGYGITGNQDGIGEYKSLFLLGAGGDSYYDPISGAWKQSYGAIQNPNPDLKWESTAQLNIGLDFVILNRITGTIEVYSKKTSDLLFTYNVPQPPYLYGTMLANVGDLTNQGIELTLGANILKSNDLRWNVNLTMAHNEQTVDKLSNDIYQTDVVYSGSLHGLTGMSNTFSQILKEGEAVGTFFGAKCLGIDENGEFIFANDGEPEVIGNAQPKLSAGLSMDFAYKNFDLNISAYGLFGQDVLNATAMNISYPDRLPAYNVLDDFLESGIKSAPVYSSYWIEKGSFVRLQNITLGYNIPLKKLGATKIRCYLTGENLFVFTNYKGIDPEVGIDGLASPGIDMLNIYPRPRTIMFGVKISL